MNESIHATNIVAPTYRALTGLENARGERVEMGEILPPDFVPDAQLEIWRANDDIALVFEDVREEENA